MTALAGTALLCSGSTTMQGPYAKQIRLAVDYLLSRARPNGLIGDPFSDLRYTYGHGFSMLFLSQVLGEEEDEERRDELVEVLAKAVEFSGRAQTRSGGWGYVSAKDGNDFDEGSTTITQVQGLRGCRNAGIAVPSEIIETPKSISMFAKNPDGGISYSSRNRGSSRPGHYSRCFSDPVQCRCLRQPARAGDDGLLQEAHLPNHGFGSRVRPLALHLSVLCTGCLSRRRKDMVNFP